MCNQKIVSFLNPLSRGYTECQDSHTTGPINKFLATKKTSCCAARARICLFVYGKSRVQFCPFAGNKTRAAQYTLTSKLLAVLVKYRPVEESTMCTTIMGPVMRESSGRASVETMCTLWHGKREKHTKQRIVDDEFVVGTCVAKHESTVYAVFAGQVRRRDFEPRREVFCGRYMPLLCALKRLVRVDFLQR